MKTQAETNLKTFLSIIYKIIFYGFWGFQILFFIAIVSFIIFPSEHKYIKESEKSLAQKNYLGAVNRAQQANYAEQMMFTDDLNEWFGSWLEEIAIDYNHHLEVNENSAIIYAVPQKEYDNRKFLGFELGKNTNKPFYGYVGGIFIVSEDNQIMDTIICKNNTIGTIKLNKPILKDNSLVCNKGTREVD